MSIASASTYKTDVATSDDAQRIARELQDAARHGELVIDRLHDAMKLLYVINGEVRSAGMEFIRFHLSAFKALIPEAERAAFFNAHLGNLGIVQVLLCDQLFDTIAAKHTEQLVRDITSRYPMPDCTWIRTASPVYRGISDAAIFECIEMQLDEQRFSLEQSRPFAESFLKHGSGSHVVLSTQFLNYDGDPYYVMLDNSPMWCKVPADKFGDIIERCVRRAPEVMFMDGRADYPDLQSRLMAVRPDANYRRGSYYDCNPTLMMDPEAVRRLSYKAADRLTTLKGLSVGMLMELRSVDHQHVLQQGLPGYLELLVRLSLHWDDQRFESQNRARQDYFPEFFSELDIDVEDALRVYRKLYFELKDAMRRDNQWRIAKKIDKDITSLLAHHGYHVSTVKREHSDRHGDQAVLRITIKGRKIKIVQNGRQREYFHTNDLVYIDLNTDNSLKACLDQGNTLALATFYHVNPHKGDNKI